VSAAILSDSTLTAPPRRNFLNKLFRGAMSHKFSAACCIGVSGSLWSAS
jgi:hypothetical protein